MVDNQKVMNNFSFSVEDAIEKLLQMVPEESQRGSSKSSLSMKSVAQSLQQVSYNPLSNTSHTMQPNHMGQHSRQMPNQQAQIAAMQMQSPQMSGMQMPNQQGQMAGMQMRNQQGQLATIQIPNQQGQITNQQGQIPNHQAQIPNHQGQIPNHQGQMQNHQGQMQNQGQIPHQHGQIPHQQGQMPSPQAMQSPYSGSMISSQSAQIGHTNNPLGPNPKNLQRRQPLPMNNPSMMMNIPGQGHQQGESLPLNIRSRLPLVPQQPASVEMEIPMLSPRTPSISHLDFPSFGQENASKTSIQSALEALDSISYANRTSMDYMPQSYTRTDSTYGNIGNNEMFDLGSNDYQGHLYGNNGGNKLPSPSQTGQNIHQLFEQSSYQSQFNAMGGLNNLNMPSRQSQDSSFLVPSSIQKGGPVSPEYNISDVYNRQVGNNGAATSNMGSDMMGNIFGPPTTLDQSLAPSRSPNINVHGNVPNQISPNATAFNSSQVDDGFSFHTQHPAQRDLLSTQSSDVVASKPPTVPKSAPTKSANGESQPRRKTHGFRKPAISLDPQERESLEKLIEEVIIGGVGEDIMQDEDTTSSEDEEVTEVMASEIPETAEAKETKIKGSKEMKAFDGKTEGKGKKGKKNGKDETSGKAHPSHLKVAAKHMKNLPPRFLRRLQVAQKQGEIKVDGTIENLAQLGLIPPDQLDEEEKEPEPEQEVEKERDKKKTEQPKKVKKKKNLLESLNPYFDDMTIEDDEENISVNEVANLEETPENLVPYEECVDFASYTDIGGSTQQSGLLHTPEKGGSALLETSPLAGLPNRTSPKPNRQQQQVLMNSPNIILRQAAVNCQDLERELMKQGGHGREDTGRYAEPPRPQRLAGAGVGQMLGVDAGSNENLDRWSQFSVDAPEFVPRSFTPINPAQTAASSAEILTEPALQSRLNTVQPFPMKAGSPFQALQPPLVSVSPQVVPPQVTAAQLASQSRHSPSPTFLIPKVSSQTVNPVAHAAMQAHPNIGVIPYPYPVASFPYPPTYAQVQYRPPPFIPPGGAATAYPNIWSTDSKAEMKAGTRPAQPQAYAYGTKVQQQHVWQQNVHGMPPRSSPVSHAMMGGQGSPGIRRRDQKYGEGQKPRNNPSGDGRDVNSMLQSHPVMTDSDVHSKERISIMLREGKKVLILMRGPPGSGKSTLARYKVYHGLGGLGEINVV